MNNLLIWWNSHRESFGGNLQCSNYNAVSFLLKFVIHPSKYW